MGLGGDFKRRVNNEEKSGEFEVVLEVRSYVRSRGRRRMGWGEGEGEGSKKLLLPMQPPIIHRHIHVSHLAGPRRSIKEQVGQLPASISRVMMLIISSWAISSSKVEGLYFSTHGKSESAIAL